jgi:DNA helicase-2/ATP-dependent DNA helicase PcrA
MQPLKAVQYILKEMGYNKYLADFASKYNTDLKDLNAVAGQFETSVKQFKSIEELLVHIDKVSSDSFSAKDDNGVILSTIHGVKGMEFKNVFIINCCEGLIPITHDNSINIEEERRLFYVGITRAKENLCLFIPKRVENLERDISRFIEEISIKN